MAEQQLGGAMTERKPVSYDEWLFRRGYATPEKKYMNPDGTATSRVFKLREKDNGELSVDVVALTSPEKSVGDPAKFMLFKIANAAVTNLDLQSLHAPQLDGSNDAHAVIVGLQMEDEIKPGLLAKRSFRIHL